ncbi:FAD-binding oxidoreductase [Pantoea sp. GbtcB22]|uniref:FAD-binding oxidoreductase n=1 Tax=Pantoea sp. GbtcB22 TaxID=2824767 RepID=UPI001C308989|nr:FAD-binding oxidoreductase [Pantoea sp. GbtcB22]
MNDLFIPLRHVLEGDLLLPQDAEYDAARRVRNARIDVYPAAIARCVSVADIQHALQFASRHDLPVALRGGGAHVAGYGTCQDGLVLDLSRMKQIEIDAEKQLAHVAPGVTWGELDAATQSDGLAVPGPRNPTIGIAGHTLGGGVGDLSRQFGLTSDNLVSCQLVTVAGDVLEVSHDSDAELFWGLRGAGGNLGVVSRFTFKLHPVTHVVAGVLAWPAKDIPQVLRLARSWLAEAPDKASLIALVWTAPPLPFLPESLHFERSIMLIPTWFGDPDEADQVLGPLKADALCNTLQQMRYADYQSLLPSAPHYQQQHVYNRGELLRELDDSTLAQLLTLFDRSGPNFSLVFGALGGAISRAPAGETAFAHRDANWFVEVCAQWYGQADSPELLAPAIEAWQLLQPVSCGPYANLLPDHQLHWAKATYGKGWERLLALKQRFDPTNRLRYNVNIVPESPRTTAPDKEELE